MQAPKRRGLSNQGSTVVADYLVIKALFPQWPGVRKTKTPEFTSGNLRKFCLATGLGLRILGG